MSDESVIEGGRKAGGGGGGRGGAADAALKTKTPHVNVGNKPSTELCKNSASAALTSRRRVPQVMRQGKTPDARPAARPCASQALHAPLFF